MADAEAWETESGVCRDDTGLACERNVLRYRPTPVVVRAAGGTHPADLVRVVAAGVRTGAYVSLSVADEPPVELAGALAGAGVDVDVEAPGVWSARLADLAAAEVLGLRVRILGPREETADTRWREASRLTKGSPDVALYTGPVTTCPHTVMLPFLHEQAVAITNHRFGTPLDLAAGLL